MNTTVSFASASDTREQKPQLRELAPNVYGYISDFDPNCGFIVGDDHVVLIDTRPTPRMARDFLADIRTRHRQADHAPSCSPTTTRCA